MDKRLGLRGLVVLSLLLGAACSEDDADDDDSVEENPTGDSGTGGSDASGSNTPRDASTSVVDSGGGETPRDAGNGSTGNRDAATDAGTAADTGASAAKNIVELAVADGRFTTLAKALTDANLVATLQGAGPFTVFAPTDAAFQALGSAAVAALTPDELKTVLQYHVVAGQVLSTDLKAGPVKTASGLTAFVSTTGGAKINGATVTTADVKGSNGVIHVIDKVLLPPDVVEAAQLAGSFTSLVGAVTKANLVSTLKTTQNITVFAPTDAAFTALGQATVDGLSVAALTDVLKYHVVAQRKLSTELVAGPVPSLLTGKNLTVSLTGGVKVNDANVVIADVVTKNGVIHAIDKVLLPPM